MKARTNSGLLGILVAASAMVGLALPAAAGDAAQRAYEAVTQHLTLARACGADAYARAKSEAQETLDAGRYMQGTAADLIASIEIYAPGNFPASYCRDALQDIEWNLPALREELARSD